MYGHVYIFFFSFNRREAISLFENFAQIWHSGIPECFSIGNYEHVYILIIPVDNICGSDLPISYLDMALLSISEWVMCLYFFAFTEIWCWITNTLYREKPAYSFENLQSTWKLKYEYIYIYMFAIIYLFIIYLIYIVYFKDKLVW